MTSRLNVLAKLLANLRLRLMLLVSIALLGGFLNFANAQQKVLILGTDNAGLTAARANDMNNVYANMTSEFAAVVGAANITIMQDLEYPNTVSPATFLTAPGPYDVVIVASAYESISPSNWAAINAAIQAKLAKSFVLFMDGCCATQNIPQLIQGLNDATGFSITQGPSRPALFTSPLNTAIPASASFTALNPMGYGFTTDLNNVPVDNALYLAPGAVVPPVGTVLNNVTGVFVPDSQSYNGSGACLFGVVDLTQFTASYSQNQGRIGPAFMDAVNNSCTAGGLRITKTLTNAPAGGVPGDYDFSISCDNPTQTYTGTVTLVANQLSNDVSVAIPDGSTNCTVTETSKPAAPVDYVWGAPQITQPPSPLPILDATSEAINPLINRANLPAKVFSMQWPVLLLTAFLLAFSACYRAFRYTKWK